MITRLSGAHLGGCNYSAIENNSWEAFYTSNKTSSNLETADAVECVLRCDLSVWAATGLSLRIQPPHTRASVLVRHRLSDRGPGCWITIEHSGDQLATAVDEAGVISVVVTKAPLSKDSKDKHGVWINGARVKAEIEEIKEEEVKELKSKRRIRSRALLLDQSLASQRTLHRPRSSLTLGKDDISAANTPLGTSRPPSIIIKDDVTVHPPMHYALEGLAWLQALHADLTESELFENATDWTVLSFSENNSPIHISKRIVPRLSAAQLLFKVERTFPGISAEHVLERVSCLQSSSRNIWDDRLLSVQPIHHYRLGASTAAWTSKPSFPLRSRIAYVANAKAQFIVPAQSGSAKSTSRILLFASASFPQASLDLGYDSGRPEGGLDKEKLNPGKLAEGKVFLEGWILEEGEYPSDEDEDDDVPSTRKQIYTRCTYYTCTDLPTSASGAFGLGNARTRLTGLFDALEKCLRSGSVPTILHSPVPVMQIEGSLQRHEGMVGAWELSDPATPSFSVLQNCSSAGFTFAISLAKTFAARASENGGTPAGSKLDGDKNDGSVANSNAKPPLARSTGSSASLTRYRSNSAPSLGDMVVAEIIFHRDPTLAGYDLASSIAVVEQFEQPFSSDTSQWKEFGPLPLKVSAYPASFPVGQATRYLVRITLPTTQYTAPIQHPLSSLTSKPSLPAWFRKIVEGKLLLHLQCLPNKLEMQVEGRPASPLKFTFNGNTLALASEAESKPIVSQLDDEGTNPVAIKLIRSFQESGTDAVLPSDLLRPMVVNQSVVVTPAPPPPTDAPGTPRSPTPVAENGGSKVASESTLANAVCLQACAGEQSDFQQATNIEKAAQPIVELFTTTEISGKKGSQPILQRTYKFSFVILVAVISFLIGSLLRSLLSPNDYVMFKNKHDAVALQALEPSRSWKYAIRLIHIHLPIGRRDFVASLVEKD